MGACSLGASTSHTPYAENPKLPNSGSCIGDPSEALSCASEPKAQEAHNPGKLGLAKKMFLSDPFVIFFDVFQPSPSKLNNGNRSHAFGSVSMIFLLSPLLLGLWPAPLWRRRPRRHRRPEGTLRPPSPLLWSLGSGLPPPQRSTCVMFIRGGVHLKREDPGRSDAITPFVSSIREFPNPRDPSGGSSQVQPRTFFFLFRQQLSAGLRTSSVE